MRACGGNIIGKTDDQIRALYGWNEAEALSMHRFDILPEAGHSAMLKMIRRVQGGETPAPTEMSRITKAGETIQVRLRMSLPVDEQGAPRAIATTEQRVDPGYNGASTQTG